MRGKRTPIGPEKRDYRRLAFSAGPVSEKRTYRKLGLSLRPLSYVALATTLTAWDFGNGFDPVSKELIRAEDAARNCELTLPVVPGHENVRIAVSAP
jgi:hypothetical protein